MLPRAYLVHNFIYCIRSVGLWRSYFFLEASFTGRKTWMLLNEGSTFLSPEEEKAWSAGVTRRFHKTTFRGFFCKKLVDFFTYALAPFLTTINSVHRTYTFYTYRNKLTNFLLSCPEKTQKNSLTGPWWSNHFSMGENPAFLWSLPNPPPPHPQGNPVSSSLELWPPLPWRCSEDGLSLRIEYQIFLFSNRYFIFRKTSVRAS